MSRNPLLLKCKTCGDFQHHWIMYLETLGKKAKVCYVCDEVRDIADIKDVEFQGHTMEVIPLETALHKEGDTREDQFNVSQDQGKKEIENIISEE